MQEKKIGIVITNSANQDCAIVKKKKKTYQISFEQLSYDKNVVYFYVSPGHPSRDTPSGVENLS